MWFAAVVLSLQKNGIFLDDADAHVVLAVVYPISCFSLENDLPILMKILAGSLYSEKKYLKNMKVNCIVILNQFWIMYPCLN